jgi:hypothetical protein
MNDTPTPRTADLRAAYVNFQHGKYTVDAGDIFDFCRKLERELTAVTEQRDRLAEALRECKEDSEELLEERKWWENEPRAGFAAEYQKLTERIENANKALATLKP